MLDCLRSHVLLLVALTVIAVVGVQVSGAHLHRLVEMPGADSDAQSISYASKHLHASLVLPPHQHEAHHHADMTGIDHVHVDMELEASVNSLSGWVHLGAIGVALLLAYVVLELPLSSSVMAPLRQRVLKPPRRAYLRPLLRGPPLIAL